MLNGTPLLPQSGPGRTRRRLALATLGGEVPRHDGPVRETFTAAVRSMAARIGSMLPVQHSGDREAEALGITATLVGTLVLARAVADPALSDRILEAGRARATASDGEVKPQQI
ncbi:hypothetical protein [Neoroseomonas lacus]|uniref:hypothetical protein n=1 Tax=Neoroseomonas lacus TaxID=287609 RepID=UPI0016685017|nr:hypothetical protein [Neoroseomonas lacus]